ncbi:uncharacterized protein LOC124265727 [Haliotis rubra]|uniref:uncharacterized protein LOC124265727 n=1 Tax=Haliotis rubra TaxID=36100 RepID=UPI001EE544D9|nr:uncharacterized protein LOC124265727 [Haliotis rubra]
MECRGVCVAVTEGRPLLLDCSENMTSVENMTFTWEDNADSKKYFRYWQESTRSLARTYTCKVGGVEAVVFIVTVEYLDNLELDVTPSDTCNVNNVTATCAVDSNAETTLTIHREDTNETYTSQGQNMSRQLEVQCGQTVRVRCTATSGQTSRVQFRQLNVLCAPGPHLGEHRSRCPTHCRGTTSHVNVPDPLVHTFCLTLTLYRLPVYTILQIHNEDDDEDDDDVQR